MRAAMRYLAEAKWRPLRPASDHWFEVGHEVLRYVDGLEERLDRSDYDVELARLERDEQVRALRRELADKDRQIKRLRTELALANERAAQTSRNSSKPPSSDPPSAPKPPARVATGKRRGGQPGHRFHARALGPVDEFTEVTDHKPERCAACDAELVGEDPSPLRHQIVELSVARPLVFEHRLHSLRCACGHTTRACLPEHVTANGFGPGVEGTVATLVAGCRLSHRMIRSVMLDLFGVSIGLGTVTRLLARSSSAVERPVEEARAYLRWNDGTKHVDETETAEAAHAGA